MSSVSFKDLRIIVNQLTRQEASSARKFLVAFDSTSHKTNNKNSRLFEFLIENPMATYAQSRMFEGIRTDKKSFDQTCRRLKDRITESLILDVNITRVDITDTCLSRKLFIQKKLLIASVLLERGAGNEAVSICNKVVKIAKEYEFYSEVHQALSWIRHETPAEGGLIDRLAKELEFYRYCDQALYRARELYCMCAALPNTTRPDEARLRALASARGELAMLHYNTRSATIAYYYYLVEIRYNFATGNFQSCCDFGIKLTSFVSSHPVLRTEIRLGSAYVELAASYQVRGDDSQALLCARSALELLPETSHFYEKAKEIEFKTLYNLERKEEASISLEKLIELCDRKKHPLVYWKRLFYQACLNFSLKNYAGTIKLMERIGKIKTEQEGWNIGRRVITILCKIEMSDFDEADRHIESLRKYLQRNQHPKPEDHYKNILRALIQLSNKSYSFDAIEAIISFNLTQEMQQKARPATPDMKVFMVWYNSKLNMKKHLSKAPDNDLENGTELEFVA